MNDISSRQLHHRHLEQARAQVIELLSRQAVERELVNRSGEGAERSAKQDVVALLVARQHQAALDQRLAGFHPADIAFVLESLEPEPRDLAWSLVRPERRGAVLLETADVVRRALVCHMPADEVADVVRPLDPEDIAELIASLPEESRRAVLERLDKADLAEVR